MTVSTAATATNVGQPRYDHQKTNPRHDRRHRRVIFGSLARGKVCFVFAAAALDGGH